MSRLFARLAPKRRPVRDHLGIAVLVIGVCALAFRYYRQPVRPWRGEPPHSGVATLVRVVYGHHGKVAGSYTYLVRFDAGFEATATLTDIYPLGSRVRLLYRPVGDGSLRVYQYSPCADDCQ
jgi:hypothetical protein